MCTVSMLLGQLGHTLPAIPSWPAAQLYEFAEIIKRLDAIDAKLGLRDCSDPAKDEIRRHIDEALAPVRERLDKLEKRARGKVAKPRRPR